MYVSVVLLLQLSDSVREGSYFGASKMIFRQLMQMTAFGIGLEVIMGGYTYFDVHYGVTGVNVEMSNMEELTKSTEKTQVFLLIYYAVYTSLCCLLEMKKSVIDAGY